MCGIGGSFAYSEFSKPVDRRELSRIQSAMENRGPDGAGCWVSVDSRVGFVHRRLAIIDLSDGGAQPMASDDGALVITFNGEIYNFVSLRADLIKEGHKFRSNSDTEVLLHLYSRYGQRMVDRLRGMFAFAIWDGRSRGVFMARDPFGIKPLYYSDDGKKLWFASQVKALLQAESIDRSPQAAGHAGFFLWGHVPEPHSLYRGIKALPAGSTLWIDCDGCKRLSSYFDVKHLFGSEVFKAEGGDKNPCGELPYQIAASVSRHMVADVPVGVFLSAGVDSGSITAIASEGNSSPLRTLTLGFSEYKGTADDEAPLAAQVAAFHGTFHTTDWITKADFQEDLPGLLRAMDQPTIDGVNTYFVSRSAKRAGIKVALSGLGGDELFGGYPSFRQIPAVTALTRFLKRAPALGRGFRVVSAPILRQFASNKSAGILEYGTSYATAYLLRRGLFMPWELPEILGSNLAKAGWEELQTLDRLEETISGISLPHLRVAALEIAWYMRNQLLRDVDWASMAHSVEVRVPLIDIEVAAAMAACARHGGSPSKRAMTDACRNRLPPAVLCKPKSGFRVPVREWLREKDDKSRNRGMRGWARQVYAGFI